MAEKIYTIGYSGFHETGDFVAVLKQYGIQILIDVRSSPFSAYYENYNRDRISPELKRNGIYYANYAVQFGARQERTCFYKNGRLDFETFSKSEQFLEGIRNVEKSKAVICLMCAEKHPDECHRTVLVARVLRDRGNTVEHIVPADREITKNTDSALLDSGDNERQRAEYEVLPTDTVTISQEEIDELLLNKYFPDRDQMSLFSEINSMTHEDYITEAYRRRNDEIGYKQEDLIRA